MKLHYLQIRRNRVSNLLSLAMADRNALKCLQANYLLAEINRQILREYATEEMYSNL